MGFSGMKGKVYHLNAECPTMLDGSPPVGAANLWFDEVTRFVVSESANIRRYGHDKSYGWQATCSGIRRVEVALDCVVAYQNESADAYNVGQVVYLILHPFGSGATAAVGTCDGLPISGYFVVDRMTLTTDLENGRPVEYSMSLVSKGYINGMQSDQQLGIGVVPNWGGFECGCVSEPIAGVDSAGSFTVGNLE
jgi:hypothetical protein